MPINVGFALRRQCSVTGQINPACDPWSIKKPIGLELKRATVAPCENWSPMVEWRRRSSVCTNLVADG